MGSNTQTILQGTREIVDCGKKKKKKKMLEELFANTIVLLNLRRNDHDVDRNACLASFMKCDKFVCF